MMRQILNSEGIEKVQSEDVEKVREQEGRGKGGETRVGDTVILENISKEDQSFTGDTERRKEGSGRS